MSEEQVNAIIYGSNGERIRISYVNSYGEKNSFSSSFEEW